MDTVRVAKMAYLCRDCGELFREPAREEYDPSPPGISLSPGFYADLVCPFCRSTDFVSGVTCGAKGCANLAFDNETLCDACKDKIWVRLNEAVLGIIEEFGASRGREVNEAIWDVIDKWREEGGA